MDTHQLKLLKNSVIGDVVQKKQLSESKGQVESLIDQISPSNLHNQVDTDRLIQSSLIIGSLYTNINMEPNHQYLLINVLDGVVKRLVETATVCNCQRVLEYLFRCLRNASIFYKTITTFSNNNRAGIDKDSMQIDDDICSRAAAQLNNIFFSPHLPNLLKHLTSSNRKLVINLITLLTTVNDTRHKASLLSVEGLLDHLAKYIYCDVQKLQIAALKLLGSLCKDYSPAVLAFRQVQMRAIPSLTIFFECKSPQLRLEACKTLVHIIKSQQSDLLRPDGPPTIQLISTIDRPKALELIEQLIRLLDENIEIQIPASSILATILSDATDLEDHACKSGILNKLNDIFQTCLLYEKDEYNVEGSKLSEDNLKLQEGILMIVAALALHLDELRTLIVDAHLLKAIAVSLQHKAKGIRGSAAQCIRALSRSVGVLRTSLVDSGVELTLLSIISNDEENERNKVIALMALANLVCGFSPLKQKLIQNGGVKILVKLTYSKSHKVRLNTLWAIKNMVFAASTELKRFICDQIGYNHFKKLLNDSNSEVVEQVLFVLRNLVTREGDINLVCSGFGGEDKFLEIIEHKFQTNQVEILLQAAYVVNNVATGSYEQKKTLLWRPLICSNLKRLLTHWDERVRAAAVWTLRNLSNSIEGQPYQARSEIRTRMRLLEFDKSLLTLSQDKFSVSEPARLALDGMNT
ncbi:hypothetical protein E3P92_04074 [Wallemia ichthyophaga]|nr:hypothetical protein E3P92_04074 [Wallemia ichthyophaga]TIB57909.1 hypothetical protein E3P78_04104 [Wallemia ichthyophaga]